MKNVILITAGFCYIYEGEKLKVNVKELHLQYNNGRLCVCVCS